jgi:L-iditol 2-dehydrogenase
MGHEAAGVIAEVGENVTGWDQGDRVTFDSTVFCGSCWFCQRGWTNLCDHRTVLGVSCEEYRQHGAFAEYVAVPHQILHRLPEAVSFEQAAMVEAVSIAVHAVGLPPISLGDTAVVVGVGMIGLLAVQALRVRGCGKIIAVDLVQEKLDLALKLGADVSLKADGCNVVQEVKNQTQGRGADVAMEVVGTNPAVNSAIACLRKGGKLALVGNLNPRVELPLQAVVTRQLTLYGSCASSGEYPACLDLMARGAINTEALVSATPPLSEGETWFKRLYEREPGLMKVILLP